MKNLELKVKYANEDAFKLVENLSCSSFDVLYQEDVYFNVEQGRLKLRSINNLRHELIYYLRSNTFDAKDSYYEIYETTSPESLKTILEKMHGVKVVVSKKRSVYIYKDCRIHIDYVSDLGEFLEFEVVMIPGRTEKQAKDLINFLKITFNIIDNDLIDVSYSDLLLFKK